jgi:hypothetical protein
MTLIDIIAVFLCGFAIRLSIYSHSMLAESKRIDKSIKSDLAALDEAILLFNYGAKEEAAELLARRGIRMVEKVK